MLRDGVFLDAQRDNTHAYVKEYAQACAADLCVRRGVLSPLAPPVGSVVKWLTHTPSACTVLTLFDSLHARRL